MPPPSSPRRRRRHRLALDMPAPICGWYNKMQTPRRRCRRRRYNADDMMPPPSLPRQRLHRLAVGTPAPIMNILLWTQRQSERSGTSARNMQGPPRLLSTHSHPHSRFNILPLSEIDPFLYESLRRFRRLGSPSDDSVAGSSNLPTICKAQHYHYSHPLQDLISISIPRWFGYVLLGDKIMFYGIY
jgi:hypothetical protein